MENPYASHVTRSMAGAGNSGTVIPYFTIPVIRFLDRQVISGQPQTGSSFFQI